jgi:hypothetical protein
MDWNVARIALLEIVWIQCHHVMTLMDDVLKDASQNGTE